MDGSGRQNFWQRNIVMIVLMTAGLLLRLEYLREFSASELFAVAIGPDVEEYDAWARRIVTGMFLPPELPIHSPGYPWILSFLYQISGNSIPFARAVQLIGNWVFWGYFYCFLRDRVHTEKRLHDFFLALAMFYPVLWFYQAELISESVLPVLLLLSCTQLTIGEADGKARHRLFAGLWSSLAAVTHPVSLFFAAGELAWFLWRRQYRFLLLFAAGLAVLVVPVSLVSSVTAGKFVLIQGNGAFNLWLGNNPESTGGCYLRPGAAWHKTHQAAQLEAEKQATSADRVYLERIGRFWRDQPLAAIGNLARKALLVWSAEERVSGADNMYVREYTLIQQYGSGFFSLVLLMALGGLVLMLFRREDFGKYKHFLWLTGAFYATQILTVTSGRYRLAMLPGLFLLAAYLLSRLSEIKRNRTQFYAVFGSMMAFLLLRLAFYQTDRNDLAQARAETMSLYAEAAYRRGDWDTAETRLKEAAKHIDYPARFYNLLGEIARKKGRYQEAFGYFARARIAAPEDPDAAMNSAMLYAEEKKDKEAERMFAESFARSLHPSAQLHYNYAYYCESRKQLQQAEYHYRQAIKRDGAFRPAWNALGVLELQSGRLRQAVHSFEQALKLDPKNAGVQRNLQLARNLFAGQPPSK